MDLKPILSAVVALWCSTGICADTKAPTLPTIPLIKACDNHMVGYMKIEKCPDGKAGIVTSRCTKDGFVEDEKDNTKNCKDKPAPKK